jgi:flagellar basal-body rod protein FlgB
VVNHINTLTLNLANKSLDALWTRANVISQNIANADTPGYTQQDVSFEAMLSDALDDNSLSEIELSAITPEVAAKPGTVDANGNSVDMDSQMVELARNQLQYSYMRKALSDGLIMLRNAASEGRS